MWVWVGWVLKYHIGISYSYNFRTFKNEIIFTIVLLMALELHPKSLFLLCDSSLKIVAITNSVECHRERLSLRGPFTLNN